MYVWHWNLTTDILHNQKTPKEYRVRFIFYRNILLRLNGVSVSLKIACLCLTESSLDIVESSRYIPRDRSHMYST